MDTNQSGRMSINHLARQHSWCRVTYDAGAHDEANAKAVVDAGKPPFEQAQRDKKARVRAA